MKYLQFALGLLFFWAAVVQFNDPDPLYWIVTYTAVAAIAIGKGFGFCNRTCAVLVLGNVLAGMLVALPGFFDYLFSGNFGSLTGDMREAGYVEPAREFLGLFIAICVLVLPARFESKNV